VLTQSVLWSSAGKFCSYISNSDGGEEMKYLEMKHFVIGLLCVFVGVLTGLLLSEAVISPFFPGTETVMAKNGLVVLTYH
jgi:hypothetical protein